MSDLIEPPAHEFDPDDIPMIREMFYEFAAQVKIDSKEAGVISFTNPYFAQRMFFDGVFAGLQKDIHWFVILKARQLGITTGSILLDLFWISYFPGLQGGLVTDTAPNKEKIRILITRMLESLPRSFAIPIVSHNKDGLVLSNGSSLDYLVAGTRKNGGLGRSRAYNFLHATECSSWGDQEGLESLQKSLAAEYPARLYMFESTARGYNMFHEMWEDAREDPMVKQGIFIGWWAKESYSFNPSKGKKQRELYEKYSAAALTEDEQELIAYVQRKYDFEVTLEQLAWYRHEKDPSGEGNIIDETGASIIEQELPWHEEQAFMLTGSTFFSSTALAEAAKECAKLPYKGYRYYMGEQFLATTIEPVKNAKLAQLKVWEEPDPAGTYVIGADPAYGSSDEADRYVAQIFRVYADGMDQVAEFASPSIKTYQFSWIVAHLAGLYGNARLLLELNGPGEAVFTEFRHLQTQLTQGLIVPPDDKKGLRNVLLNVRNYLYSRADSMGGGVAYHWRTTLNNKAVIFNQFRDGFAMGQIRLKSLELLEEMRKIVQDGLSIKGEGSAKDDRVMAAALSTRAWIDGERKRMESNGLTRAAEREAKNWTQEDMTRVFTGNVVADFLRRQQMGRDHAARMARRGKRWNW